MPLEDGIQSMFPSRQPDCNESLLSLWFGGPSDRSILIIKGHLVDLVFFGKVPNCVGEILQMWKLRHELPIFEKLSHYQFDPQLLLEAYREAETSSWDGLVNEYSHLCQTYSGLPKFFFSEDELSSLSKCEDSTSALSYQQMSFVEFDPEFSLSNRKELSGTRWDTCVAKDNKRADERWLRKRKSTTPEYFNFVIESVGSEIVHRTRLAKLKAKSSIKPHIDYNTTYGLRLHVPIVTHPECRFGGVDKEGNAKDTHMPADGSVWFINPGLKHWATNASDIDRVHLIISVDSQKWFL